MPRDFGTAEIGGVDIASELLKNGWAKVKEIKREPTDEDTRKRELENEAKSAGKGLWNPHGPKVRIVCIFGSSVTDVSTGPRGPSHNAYRLANFCFGMERKIFGRYNDYF